MAEASMVERVASGIEKASYQLGLRLIKGEKLDNGERARVLALAAIAAMRTPDESMMDQIVLADWCPSIPEGCELYEAMIDAALKPEPLEG